MVTGNQLVTLIADSRDSHGPGSNAVVTYCESGSRVYVRCHMGPCNISPGSGSDFMEKLPTFSGVLLA